MITSVQGWRDELRTFRDRLRRLKKSRFDAKTAFNFEYSIMAFALFGRKMLDSGKSDYRIGERFIPAVEKEFLQEIDAYMQIGSIPGPTDVNVIYRNFSTKNHNIEIRTKALLDIIIHSRVFSARYNGDFYESLFVNSDYNKRTLIEVSLETLAGIAADLASDKSNDFTVVMDTQKRKSWLSTVDEAGQNSRPPWFASEKIRRKPP